MTHHNLLVSCLIIPLAFITTSALAQSGWVVLNPGTVQNLQDVFLLDYQHVYVAGDGGLILASSDSGHSWQDISPPALPVNLNGIVFFDSLSGLVVGDNGTILRTGDAGTSWTPVASGVSDDLLSVSFFDSSGVCGALSQTILNSTDRGVSWRVAQSGFFGGGFWGSCMLSPRIGQVIGENSIFQPLLGTTSDGGQNWNFTAFYLNNNEGRAYDVIFTDHLTGYAACRVWDGRGAIARTGDGGTSWVTTFIGSPLYGICFPISNASLVGFAVGENGVILKTYDAGTSWQAQTGITAQRLNRADFRDLDYGFIVGNGGTILKTETGGEPWTGIPVPVTETSADYALLANYPNPFNARTIISWFIPNPAPGRDGQLARQDGTAGLAVGGPVNLTIYDVTGQWVVTLADETYPAGNHSMVFDGSKLASGVYYCRLRAGNQIRVRKMILMK